MSEHLPTVSGTPDDARDRGPDERHDHARAPNATGDAAPESPPAWRLLSTLAVAGALAGLLLVVVFQATNPAIQAHRARVLAEAVHEVLGGPERYETLFLVDGRFTVDPAGADTAGLDRVYLGYGADERPLGLAIEGGEPGFQDVIRLIFGYEPASGRVLGMKVLESKETPGLGDKIEKDSSFVGAFRGVLTPLLGVKRDRATGSEGEVELITGATISSRAIVDIINHRLEELDGELRAFTQGQVATAPPPQRRGGRP